MKYIVKFCQRYSSYCAVAVLLVTALGIFHLKLDISSIAPQNVDFLLQGKDWSQHFLGWHFYRSVPWGFPVGDFTGLVYPSPTNIGYTDSIPLMAVPLKLIAPFVGAFQYIGPWLFSAIALQGILGYFILRNMRLGHLYSVLGGILLQMSPVLMARFGHPALSAHWVLLLAFLVYLNNSYSWKSIVSMKVAMILAAWIHPYLGVMNLIILLAYAVRAPKWYRKVGLSAVLLGLLLGSWYIIGYLTSYATSNMPGLGFYTSYLTTFLHAPESRFLAWIPYQERFPFEGYAFMGLGTILGILGVGGVQVWRSWKTKTVPIKNVFAHWPMILGVGAITIFSLIRFPVFEMIRTSELAGSASLHKLFTTFRATGRFIWPLYYAGVLTFLILLGRQFSRRVSVVILALVILVNVGDAPAIFATHYKDLNLSPRRTTQLYQDIEGIVPEDTYTHMMFYPTGPNKSMFFEADDYIPFAFVAANNNMNINIGYLARMNDAIFKDFHAEFNRDIQQGNLRPEYLYLIPNTHVAEVRRYLQQSESSRELVQLNDQFWYIP